MLDSTLHKEWAARQVLEGWAAETIGERWRASRWYRSGVRGRFRDQGTGGRGTGMGYRWESSSAPVLFPSPQGLCRAVLPSRAKVPAALFGVMVQ